MAEQVIAEYKLDVNQAVKGLDKLQAETKQLDNDLDKAGKDGTKALESVDKGASKLSSGLKKLGGVLLAAFAVDRVIALGKEMVDLAAKAEGIRTAFSKLDSPNLLANLRKATRGAVTDVELMRQAVRANNFQVPLEKLATFFEFATKRSIETGESVDYLVSSIIDGIGRKSTLVLDNLGISATQLQEEIKKTGDFGQAAANIIEKSLSETGDVADTTAVKMAQLSTATENLKTALGALVAENAKPVITFLTNISTALEQDITALDRFTEKIRGQSSYKLLGTQAEETAKLIELEKEATEAAGKVRDAEFRKLLAKVDAQRAVVEAIKLEFRSRVDNNQEIEITTELIQKEIDAYNERNAQTERTIITIASLNAELKVLQQDLENAEVGSSSFFSILDKLDAKIKEITEADALTKLADALKVDEEETPDITGFVIDYAQTVESETDIASELWNKHFEELMNSQDEEFANRKSKIDQTINITRDALSSIGNFGAAISNLVNSQIQNDLEQLQQQYDQGLISREEFERKQVELQRKSAQAAKDSALFQAVIGTSQAVINALTSPGVPYPVAAGFAALAAATGAIQIAAIASEPLPQFKDGGLVKEHGLLKGKSHAQGGVHVEAEGNEYFMPTKPTLKNYGLLEAMRKGIEEQYIMKHYVPRMIDESMFKGMNDIGKSAELNGLTATLKDHNLIAAIDRDRSATVYGLNMVASKLDKLNKRNQRTGW